jgi:hypothetical protein
MKALISPNESVYSFDGIELGIRVVQINAQEFPVAEPLYWIDCADDITPETVYYDAADNAVKQKPVKPITVISTPQVDDHSEI